MLAFLKPVSRRHVALRGLIAAAVGAVLIAWPGITIGTVAVLFAVAAFADAFSVGGRALRSRASTGDRALLALRAAIETIAGIVALAYPGATAAVMTVVVGLSLVVVGGIELAGAGRLAQIGDRIGGMVAGGLLSVLAGIVLVVWPGIGAVTLAVLFGAYLVVSGGALLIGALAMPRNRPVVEPLVRA